MARVLIITDLDNTIYNWVDYFGKSFRGMVHALSKRIRVEENILIEDFRRVYKEKGSIEYAFAVQELEICRSLSSEETKELVDLTKGTFRKVRDKNLQAYEGVKQTLQWARNNRFLVVGVTNAPIALAQGRLKWLHIDHLFSGLAAWEGFKIPNNYPWMITYQEREESGKYKSRIKKLWKLSKEELKPSTSAYIKIIEDLQGVPENTYIIGDSLLKDIAPALKIGAVGIWAKYGLTTEQRNLDTVLRITPWTKNEIEGDKEVISPTYTIDDFSEIQEIIVPKQLRFEIAEDGEILNPTNTTLCSFNKDVFLPRQLSFDILEGREILSPAVSIDDAFNRDAVLPRQLKFDF